MARPGTGALSLSIHLWSVGRALFRSGKDFEFGFLLNGLIQFIAGRCGGNDSGS